MRNILRSNRFHEIYVMQEAVITTVYPAIPRGELFKSKLAKKYLLRARNEWKYSIKKCSAILKNISI